MLGEINAVESEGLDSEMSRGDAVQRLVHTTHRQHSELRSLELQLNHANLQVQMLSARERELRDQVDMFQFSIASAEQDKLLLESKLQDIAGFEGNCSISLKDIRGKLLNVANGKISELSRVLQKTQEQLDEALAAPATEQTRLKLENQALREEVTRISEHLAQRTVLYAAQERRFNDTTRTMGSLTNEKDTELIQLRARLQQLEQQYEKTDRAHIEAVLQTRQHEEANKRLNLQVSDAVEKIKALDKDVADLSSQNISLHATVERLRGADLNDLERDLMLEVDSIRTEAKMQEEALRRQLNSAQELLSSEAERREQLVDEVEHLRSELTNQSNILRDASSRGLVHLPSSFAINAAATTIVSEDFDAVLSHDASAFILSPEREGRGTQRGGIDKSLDNSIFAAMFGTLQGADLGVSEWADNDSIVMQAEAVKLSEASRGGQRYGNIEDDDEENEGTKWQPKDKSLPIVAVSSLHVVRGLLCELFRSFNIFQSTSAFGKRDTKLFNVLTEISKSDTRDFKSSGLWADAKRLTIETVEKSVTLESAASSVQSEGVWDEVTTLLLQILRLSREEHECMTKSQRAMRESQHSCASSALSKNFLIGGATHSEDGGTAESSFISSSTNHAPTTIEGQLKEELACLKEELILRNRREAKLRTAFKEQGAKLAIVLKRAAELSTTGGASVIVVDDSTVRSERSKHDKEQKELLAQQSDLAVRLQGEVDMLRQQIDGFREELSCAEKHAESNRHVGYAEAAEIYSGRIRVLEADLFSLLSKSATVASTTTLDAAVSAVSASADGCSQTDSTNTVSDSGEAPDQELAELRSQIRTLKQALVDSCREVEDVQSRLSSSSSEPRHRLDSDATPTDATKEVDNSTQTDPCEEDRRSVDSEQSLSFASALSQAQAQEDDEARQLMEDAVKSHLSWWEARAESWTEEQTVILKKLEEAQTSLAELSAKHEREKRQALASLRENLSHDHDEAMSSLRNHHRDEVVELISRLQREHGEAMAAATAAMQLQLHRLIASLAQDHQEEIERLSQSMDMSAAGSSSLSRDSNTTAEANTLTDAESAPPLSSSSSSSSSALVSHYESKIEQLTQFHEKEIAAALYLLKSELEKAHEATVLSLVGRSQENERRNDEEKRALINKYRSKIKQQQTEFVAERETLLQLVKQEYEETCALVEENLRSSLDRPLFYPEALSPEDTSSLFNAVLDRSSLSSLPRMPPTEKKAAPVKKGSATQRPATSKRSFR